MNALLVVVMETVPLLAYLQQSRTILEEANSQNYSRAGQQFGSTSSRGVGLILTMVESERFDAGWRL